MKQRGLIHVYTGEGKGKTTAAVGLAVRALGRGWKVCYVSFHKRPGASGELASLRKLGADIVHLAPGYPTFDKSVGRDKARKWCVEALGELKKLFRKKYGLLIIDELNIAVRDCFIKPSEVCSLLKKKPASLEIVLTGRGACKELVRMADLVSEIKNIKHPYDKGVPMRKGIEY